MRNKRQRDVVARMRRLLLIPVAIALLGAAKYDPGLVERYNQDAIDYQKVPLVGLLANPAQYDGKRVQASGYLTLGFEDSGLHLDKVAYDGGLRENAVWLNKPSWLTKAERARLTNRYATVYATFHATSIARLYSGSFEEVRRISPEYTTADFQNYLFRTSNEVFWIKMRPGFVLMFLIGAVTTAVVRVLVRRMNGH